MAPTLLEKGPSLDETAAYLRGLQDKITSSIQNLDSHGVFSNDEWIRPEGGGGRSRVLQDGTIFAKAGVGISHVHGALPPPLQVAGRTATSFDAMGLSLVIHPVNPWAPTVHMNIRRFVMDDGDGWYGGGIDLSPAYVVDEDAAHFHHELKTVCDTFGPSLYPAFKAWADDYFTIKHRSEMRGIGGIFYDYLGALHPERNSGARPLPDDTIAATQTLDGFAFMQAVGNAFLPIYLELMHRQMHHPYTEAQVEWQRIRRGRYAEFNLVYDRGTTFGLQSGGRIESILMSLPPLAAWAYNHQPTPGTEEAHTIAHLQPHNWATMKHR